MKKIVAGCILIMLAACVSAKPNRFYTLTSAQTENANPVSSRKLLVGIDTVSIPGYLERPQIVTIKNNNELDLAEFDRWAEPMPNALQRIFASNMSSLMKNAIVKPASANRRSFDYIVSIELNKLDGKFNESVVLEAWWTIIDNTGKVVVSETGRYETPLGESYENLVERQSELIGKLSLDIAKKISRMK